MIIRTPILAAAERVREQCSVTTHYQTHRHVAAPPPKPRPTQKQSDQHRKRIKRLREGGMTILKISQAIGISETAVKTHMRILRAIGGIKEK